MSDTDDWVKSVAGYARKVVDSGAVGPGTYSYPISLSATDRAIVCVVVPVSGLQADYQISVTGNDTGLQWGAADNVGGSGAVFTFPLYGIIDNNAVIQFIPTGANTRLVALAVPDEILLGELNNPVRVEPVPNGTISAVIPMGGAQAVSNNSTGSGSESTLLDYPPAGYYWRLHRFSSLDLPATGGGLILLWDFTVYGTIFGDTPPGPNLDLSGQLVSTPVNVFNASTVNDPRMTLTYDLVPASLVTY